MKDISKIVVCSNINDASLIECLPIPLNLKTLIRKSIKDVWTTEKAFEDPHTFPYYVIDLKYLSRFEYNIIMNSIPQAIYSFLTTLNPHHVIWDFYIIYFKNFRLFTCELCYKTQRKLSKLDAYQLWGENNAYWWYSRVTDHKVVEFYNILNHVVKKGFNYCDLCFKVALFVILDSDTCYSQTDYHSWTEEYKESHFKLVHEK